MKITIYELLGLIKDGKAPKKIKYGRLEYEYYTDNEKIDYSFIDNSTDIRCWLSTVLWDNYIGDIFTTEVEIIEEEKDIEELNQDAITLGHCRDKINELVREIRKLKEK